MNVTRLRAVIIDSEPASRAALRQILANIPAVSVMGEYATAAEVMSRAFSERPDVLIMDVASASAPGTAPAATIARLAQRLPETVILATASDGSADFVLQLIRAGALEFVRRPVDASELTAAINKIARVRGRSPHRRAGRVTAVFAAKGGLGATTLAVNLAVCAAERASGAAALLVELDTRHSDVVTFLDLRPRYSILDVFESIERMDEALLQGLMLKHSSGLWVLPGPTHMERGYLGAEQVEAGIELLRGHYDHIVLDLRHDIDPGTVAALSAADSILFLTSLNVSALRSGAAALAAFRHLDLDVKKVKIVVTRDGTGEDVTVKHARDTLGLPVYWRTPNDYAAAIASINNGRPVMQIAPRSKFAKNVQELCDSLFTDTRVARAPAQRRGSLLASALRLKRGASGAR